MTYPEGKLIWGIPIILLAVVIELAIRKGMSKRTGIAGWIQERRLVTLTALIALGIVTVIYCVAKGQ